MQVAPKPVRYTICQGDNVDCLIESANIALQNGFQPHGDLHVHIVAGQTTYTQAMIKVELRPLELPADVQQGGNIFVPRSNLAP